MAEKYTIEHVLELCKEFDKTKNSDLLAKAYLEAADSQDSFCEKYGKILVCAVATQYNFEKILHDFAKKNNQNKENN